jgi:hypothetical protein
MNSNDLNSHTMACTAHASTAHRKIPTLTGMVIRYIQKINNIENLKTWINKCKHKIPNTTSPPHYLSIHPSLEGGAYIQ